MLKDEQTFGKSGWPFHSPAARRHWDYQEGLCPQAEKACRETIVLPWNEGLCHPHVQIIAAAIHKVINHYKR